MISIQEIAQAQVEEIDRLKAEVISIVLLRYSTDGTGYVKRGEVQQYVYQTLGFHGRCGNGFARFINKVMEQNGYRTSFYTGQRVYCGLKPSASQ